MKKILSFIMAQAERLDWKIYGPTLFPAIAFVLAIPCTFLLPDTYGVENSPIENLQAAIALAAAALCLAVRREKALFRLLSMVWAILFLREINCGRVFFPNDVAGGGNSFKSWHEISQFGRIVPVAYAMFIAWTAVYAIKHSATLARYVRYARIPAWDSIFMLVGIICGTLGETLYKNEMFEECFETLFYAAFASITWLYARNANFQAKPPAIPGTPRPKRRTGARA
ncbi:MAG: hypothetical protein LBI17_03040 [Rickettsiales bacterium]|jgi:hypothetical protein|nr:hypothetical protein [Rickettsiales bacterium]